MVTYNVKEVPMVKPLMRGVPKLFYINNVSGLPKQDKLLIKKTISGKIDAEFNPVNKRTDTFWTSFDQNLLTNIIEIKKHNNHLFTINE